MNNLTVKQKLYGALISLAVVILCFGLFSNNNMDKQELQTTIVLGLKEADTKLFLARLAQADFMVQEKPEFRDTVSRSVQSALAALEQTKQLMEVKENRQQVDGIIESIQRFNRSFSDFVKAKQNNIKVRKDFLNAAKEFSDTIDKVLSSVETYYSANQNDFEEFNRYRAAKSLKDKFNNLRVNIWMYNEHPTKNKADDIMMRISELQSVIVDLQAVMLSEQTQQYLQLLDKQFDTYQGLFSATINDVTSMDAAGQHILTNANTASEQAYSLIKNELAYAKSVQSQLEMMTYGAIIFAVMLSGGLSVWLVQSIMHPLAQSVRFAQQIAQGNLTHHIELKGSDEFTTLNQALNQSSDSLRNIIGQLKNLSGVLTESSGAIEGSVTESSHSVQLQQSETENIATAINEMTVAATQISANANQASDQSEHAASAAQTGNDVVQNTTEAMNTLSDAMTTASNVVNKLNEDTNNIGNILGVIRGIADQTNLLALNAAIEAARAGEQGRGFAVVADEVRSLAQKTQDSIEDITVITEAIQNGASDVVDVMKTSTDQSDKVVELSRRSGVAYNNIVDAISVITDMNTQVSVGATEQSTVAEDINANILRIKTIADENATGLSKIQSQINNQLQQTEALNKVIAFFRI
ncbi:methyl-accepting chemotaxis protein [uncultured Photobacterium sp.]|uniref:methyl-accepting chemotaxis protein n=1 Tax=uncultured Photobacterium sp. TaxID=173973 RepID=UPI0026262BBE|nr:methyl-accepting chemotaxis protein [uncultured Photobacterium sp.]